LPHIENLLDLVNSADYGYKNIAYRQSEKYGDLVIMEIYNSREDYQNGRGLLLQIYVVTEKDPRSEVYLPYNLTLYDSTSKIGVELYKKAIADVIPDYKDVFYKEIDAKFKDINYQARIWKSFGDREIRMFTSSGSKSIAIYSQE